MKAANIVGLMMLIVAVSLVNAQAKSRKRPCLTEPGTIRVAAETAREAWAKDPNVESFSFGPEDGQSLHLSRDASSQEVSLMKRAVLVCPFRRDRVFPIPAVLMFVGFPAAIVAAEGESAAIDVGDRKQLFIDRRFVAKADGISLELQRPQLPEENLLPATKPWETTSAGLWGSIE